MNSAQLQTDYLRICADHFASSDEATLEAAAQCGRQCVSAGIPPEELVNWHELAVQQWAASQPTAQCFPDDLAGLSAPLMESMMAYGLSFREHIERQYRTLLDARRQRIQKLEALGTFATGIAHDFNTLLGVMLGHAEMLGDFLSSDGLERQNLKQILAAIERARDLVAQLVSFGRREVTRQDLIPLDQLLQDTLHLLQPTIPPGIAFKVDLGAKDITVRANAVELRQIISNLVINAVEAMGSQGILTCRIDSAKAPEDGAENDYIELCISDNGSGISPEILPHIFEPFFTTKPADHARGLGLATVYGIVTRLAGKIDVTSQPGQGTSFHVYIPTYRPNGTPVSIEHSINILNTPRILCTETDPLLADMLRYYLQELGFAMTLVDSEEALVLYGVTPLKYQALLANLQLDGLQLVHEVRALSPHFPIILTANYSDIGLLQAQQEGMTILLKPITLKDLQRVLQPIRT